MPYGGVRAKLASSGAVCDEGRAGGKTVGKYPGEADESELTQSLRGTGRSRSRVEVTRLDPDIGIARSSQTAQPVSLYCCRTSAGTPSPGYVDARTFSPGSHRFGVVVAL